MAQIKYNPVTNAFTEYVSLPRQKVTVENPFGDILDYSDFATRVSTDGNLIMKPNTPEAERFDSSFLERMAQRNGIPSDNPKFEGGALIDNERYAYEYLIKHEIPKGAAAGIVGNLYYEGLANPTKSNKDSKNTVSYGIAQFNSEGEMKNLTKWAEDNGIKGLPDFNQQLDFIIQAIKTRPNLNILLNKNITPKEASFVWGSQFERFAGDNKKDGYKNINDSHHQRRASRASKIYKTYG